MFRVFTRQCQAKPYLFVTNLSSASFSATEMSSVISKLSNRISSVIDHNSKPTAACNMWKIYSLCRKTKLKGFCSYNFRGLLAKIIQMFVAQVFATICELNFL